METQVGSQGDAGEPASIGAEADGRVRVIEYESCDAIPRAIRYAVGLMVAGRSSAVTLVPNPVSGLR